MFYDDDYEPKTLCCGRILFFGHFYHHTIVSNVQGTEIIIEVQ